jgi:hypothetical protein
VPVVAHDDVGPGEANRGSAPGDSSNWVLPLASVDVLVRSGYGVVLRGLRRARGTAQQEASRPAVIAGGWITAWRAEIAPASLLAELELNNTRQTDSPKDRFRHTPPRFEVAHSAASKSLATPGAGSCFRWAAVPRTLGHTRPSR